MVAKYPYLGIFELNSNWLLPHLFTRMTNMFPKQAVKYWHCLVTPRDVSYRCRVSFCVRVTCKSESLSNMWVRRHFGLGLGIKANWSAGIRLGHGTQTKISWLIIWHDTGLITFCSWWVYKQQPTRLVKYIFKVVGTRLVDGTWTDTVISWSSEFCRII